MGKIEAVKARQVLDSRGFPTIEGEVTTNRGIFRGIVPSGASAGVHEALELRDGGKKFFGKAVTKAVENVNNIIGPKLIGLDPVDLENVDNTMLDLDGTAQKSKLGGNALLSVSLACARAGANFKNQELYEFLAELGGNKRLVLPTPHMVVIEGGAHGEESTDFQEFMIAPVGAKNFSEAIRYGAEVYQALKKILLEKKLNANVGFEGAFTPKLNSNSAAVELIMKAIEAAGYIPRKDIAITLDPAASEFFKDGKYELKSEGITLSPGEMTDYFMEWTHLYPIVSIEDPLAEDDWDSWVLFNKKCGSKIQIVGDDLIVTNTQLIQRAIDMGAINAALIKPNQIGTVTETINAIKLSQKNELRTVVSHRGGDTEDTFISDLVVGLGCGQSKFGATSRAERTAKYNQLLRIEEMLGSNAVYNGRII